MADEDRSFHTSTPEANRAIEQGLGAGAREIKAQRDPGGEEVDEADDVEALAAQYEDEVADTATFALGRSQPEE
jgi:hypothetical protein